jgi:uncharacterized DUF497 family protein
MGSTFEWDRVKESLNRAKHGVSFSEALTVLSHSWSVTVDDPDRSIDEERFVTIGLSSRGRLLVVVHAERGQNHRLISARRADREEVEAYVRMRFRHGTT